MASTPRFRNVDSLRIAFGNSPKGVRVAVRRVLKAGGLRIENAAVEGIIDPPKTGRIYPSKHRKKNKKGKRQMHQASAPGEFPAADSGELHQSITTVTARDDATAVIVETGANTPYADYLEFGTSKMEPRPFMTPAFRDNREAIKDQVTLAVAQAIRNAGRKGKK